MKKVITVIGARPQFIKASMISKQMKDVFEEIIVHTGQHYDNNMSDIFFEQLEIPKPNYNLHIGSGSHGQQTGRMLEEIEKIILIEKPDYVLVYGDTNSTLAGALAASKLLIPVIHVEAGLRSFNKSMPEEQNRILTDHISTILFCPTEVAVNNLKNENITNNVYQVGDVMCDSVLFYSKLAMDKIKKLDIKPIYEERKVPYEVDEIIKENLDISNEFVKDIVYGVITYKTELDNLANNLMKDWTIDRIDKSGAAILRMALYELKYMDTPEIVVINEAIELSKKYSDESVRKIINAVLDKYIKG